MKLERVCEIFLKFQPFNTITTHPHSFKTITRFSFYFPSFSPLPRLIILFLFKKLVGTSIQDWMKIMSEEKREFPMIWVRLLKRRWREVKVGLKLGGQWNVPSLVANGRWKETPFHLFPFSPQQTLLEPLIFSFDIRFYFTMVLGCYSRLSFLFFDL
jgi:hypothetical protein